jgi:hypothetical protein
MEPQPGNGGEKIRQEQIGPQRTARAGAPRPWILRPGQGQGGLLRAEPVSAPRACSPRQPAHLRRSCRPAGWTPGQTSPSICGTPKGASCGFDEVGSATAPVGRPARLSQGECNRSGFLVRRLYDRHRRIAAGCRACADSARCIRMPHPSQPPNETMDPNHREDAKSLLAAPPRVVNVGLELFAADLAGQSNERGRAGGPSPSPLVGEGRGGGSGGYGADVPQTPTPTPDPSPQGGGERRARAAQGDRAAGAKVVHVQWSPPAGGNAHLAGLLGKLRS